MNEEYDTFIELKIGHLKKRHTEIRLEINRNLQSMEPHNLDFVKVRELSDESLDLIKQMNEVLQFELNNVNKEIDEHGEKE